MISVLCGDALVMLETLPSESVQCVVTSPPYYGLRDYGVEGQLGLEETPQLYVERLVSIFREVKRVLRNDGTCWLNLGDSYAANRSYQVPDNKHCDVGNGLSMQVPLGLKPKDLIGIPWRVAFALQEDGWWLRQDIIWSKDNPMPESVTDRCTKSHEYVFLLTKSARYFYDSEAVKENGVGRETYFGSDQYSKGSGRNDSGSYDDTTCTTRNRRSVWTINTHSYAGSHFATMPPKLAETCILAGSHSGDTILDPFCGSGTTGEAAQRLGRQSILIELNPDYLPLIHRRTQQAGFALCA